MRQWKAYLPTTTCNLWAGEYASEEGPAGEASEPGDHTRPVLKEEKKNPAIIELMVGYYRDHISIFLWI